uniref:Tc1-like transposase DDE domain-containing protein n=1 Tax=Hippocampus comes TaxID=109280 RepID=A0A3Q2XA19_HIPCM
YSLYKVIKMDDSVILLVYCCQVLREKRRELWQDNSWLLHHDNTPAHNTLSVRQFLAEKNVPVLEPPPSSPDLAPFIKGSCFEDVENVKLAMTTALQRLSAESFQQCVTAWQRRLGKCARLQGDYFE